MKDDSIEFDNTKTSPEIDVIKPREEGPEDTYNICYYIFLLFGVGVLLPWNAVLTAMPYF